MKTSFADVMFPLVVPDEDEVIDSSQQIQMSILIVVQTETGAKDEPVQDCKLLCSSERLMDMPDMKSSDINKSARLEPRG